jgi:glycosyltransferase involved in cell wall biosynthesis
MALPAYVLGLRRARRALGARIDDLDPGIVHVNTSVLVVAALLPRRRRRRLVWHIHEVVRSPRSLAWLFRLLPMWRAAHVVATSDATAASLRKSWFTRARLHRIYNGIAGREVANSRCPDRPYCVFVGRLQRRKGYDLFVDAAGQIAADFPAARFAVAGSPAPGEEWRVEALRKQVAALGLTERVELLGVCHDVPSLLDRADIVVAPSREPEGFGLVVLEAMRSGSAVVASTAGATTEIMTDGLSGLLIPPGDSRMLVDALTRLLSDRGLRERLGAAGRARAGAFSQEAFRDQIVGLWRDCTG